MNYVIIPDWVHVVNNDPSINLIIFETKLTTKVSYNDLVSNIFPLF